MIPTWAISCGPWSVWRLLELLDHHVDGFSMPRLISIGFVPGHELAALAVERLRQQGAVVVPSPATSLVRDATSFTHLRPMFLEFFLQLDLLGDGDPSLVIVGAPNDFSMMTLRPLGPSVTFTASASVLTPFRIASRAARRTGSL